MDATGEADKKLYKEGKVEANKVKEAEEKGETYTVVNKEAYKVYTKMNLNFLSTFLGKENTSGTLNNPVQATSAHQTKRAATLLFDYIVDNGHFGLAKICNT